MWCFETTYKSLFVASIILTKSSRSLGFSVGILVALNTCYNVLHVSTILGKFKPLYFEKFLEI